MKNIKKLKKLQKLVKKWSDDRCITSNGKSVIQLTKLISEKSEISEGLLKNDIDLIEDAIGDTLVVMINLAVLLSKEGNCSELDLRMCNVDKQYDLSSEKALFDLDVRFGEIADGIGKGKKCEIISELNYCLRILNKISNSFNLKIEDCLEVAYNEIKDRKGVLTKEGNFVKSTDPYYEQALKDLENS